MSTEKDKIFNAHIHTEEGVEALDFTDAVHWLVLMAFRRELHLRGEPTPDESRYDLIPYVHRMKLFVTATQCWVDDSNTSQAVECKFVFMPGEIDEIPTLVPVDKVVTGAEIEGYTHDDVGVHDLGSFYALAAARTGASN